MEKLDLYKRVLEKYPEVNSDTARFMRAKMDGFIANEEYDILFRYYR
jgi:hypothetical protein